MSEEKSKAPLADQSAYDRYFRACTLADKGPCMSFPEWKGAQEQEKKKATKKISDNIEDRDTLNASLTSYMREPFEG